MPIETFKPGAKNTPPGICIYARTGVGKTTLLGTLPGQGIIIDTVTVEGGTHVLEGHDNITVIPIREWNDIDAVFWAIKKKDRRQLPTVDFSKLRWVALDSVSGMQVYAKRKVLKERDLKADPHIISLQERGKMNELVGELVFRLRTLPYAMIFTAQERKHGGGDDGEPMQLGPAIQPGALADLVPSLMLIGRLTISGSGERLLRVQPHPMYIAKCRAKPGRKMPAVVRQPHLGTILRYLLADGPRPKAARDEVLFS